MEFTIWAILTAVTIVVVVHLLAMLVVAIGNTGRRRRRKLDELRYNEEFEFKKRLQRLDPDDGDWLLKHWKWRPSADGIYTPIVHPALTRALNTVTREELRDTCPCGCHSEEATPIEA